MSDPRRIKVAGIGRWQSPMVQGWDWVVRTCYFRGHDAWGDPMLEEVHHFYLEPEQYFWLGAEADGPDWPVITKIVLDQ